MDKKLGSIPIAGLAPLRILTAHAPSIQQRVNLLVKYAQDNGFELIVVSTRGTKGTKRWFMGSFTETLILTSTTPLLVVNPFEKRPANFKHILFPTDFSPESKQAFEQVVQFAKIRKSKITLFHKFTLDSMLAFNPAFTIYPDFQKIIDEDLAWKRNEAKLWCQDAANGGVRVITKLEKADGASAAVAVLLQAKKYPGVIAMATRSNSLSATLLGSTVRKVIGEADLPVWVFRETPAPKILITKIPNLSRSFKLTPASL